MAKPMKTLELHYPMNQFLINLDIAAFQHFKVFLFLPHAFEDFGSLCDRKVKKKNICKFEFCLNRKQPLTFLPGPISDKRFMSVDAAWFCLCKNPRNCLLSMNKSARRCVFCTVSKT